MVNPEKRIDAHVHYALPLEAEALVNFLDRTGVDMANLVMVPHTTRLSCVPEALMAKAKFPDRFFVFGSLDPSNYFLHPRRVGKYMAAHAQRMLRCGCDGIKLIEGKPNMRRMMLIPDFDLPCWEPFWAWAEEAQAPILWHVNDPQEYWESGKVSDYIKARGETYDDSDVHYEAQYAQVEHIFQRHPRLKIIFAHFFFLSGDLPRLAGLLDACPNMMVDLTPGSELYRILSENHENAQAFFEKYQDRILYGTDIACRCVMAHKQEGFNLEENMRRAELVDSLLDPEVDRTHFSDGAYLIDVPPFRIRGLGLPQSAIDKIYGGNFLRFVGREKPKSVDPRAVIRECRRLKIVIRAMALFRGMKPDTGYARRCEVFFRKEEKKCH